MKRGVIIVSVIFILILQQFIYGETKPDNLLTLSKAINLTLSNNPLIKKAQAQVEAAITRVKLVKSHYFPIVRGQASYNYIGPSQSVNLGPGMNFSLFPQNNYDFSVMLSDRIYDFGRRKAMVELSKINIEEIRESLEQIKLNLTYQTVNVFYTALFLQEQLKVLDEQLKDLNQHLDYVTKKIKTGSATSYDLLNTKARVASVKNEEIEIKNQLEKQKIVLQQLTGLKPFSLFTVNGNFSQADIETDIKSLIEKAMDNRFDIKEAKDAEKLALLNLRIASLSNLPTVSTHFIFGLKNGIMPDVDSINSNWSAGIQVDVPIFSGLSTIHKKEEAKQNSYVAQENILYLKDLIRSEVCQAINDVKARKMQIESSRVQLNQAEQLVKMANVKYNIGLITNLEYLDSQTVLKQARLGYLKALYYYTLSKYKLREVIGEKIW